MSTMCGSSTISYQASKNESVKILISIIGIYYFSAMLIASEIGDKTRFSTPEKLVSWSGLCPSIHQSGILFTWEGRKMETRR